MWNMTPFGILMPAIRPPKTVPAGDDRTMQIRSRRKQDLDILRARYMRRSLGPSTYTPKFDYEWRAYCTPESYALAMVQMVMEVDYLKFKPTTIDLYGDHELHKCYNAIWSTVLRELSTDTHQDEYWVKHPSPPVKKTKSSLVRVSGAAPQPYVGRHPAVPSTLSGVPLHDDWPTRADILGDTGRLIEGQALDEAGIEVVDLPRTDDEVDDIYREIDEILDLDETITTNTYHLTCEHQDTAHARSRCRRRRRRAAYRRLDELRQQLADVPAQQFADATRDNPDSDRHYDDSPYDWPVDLPTNSGITN